MSDIIMKEYLDDNDKPGLNHSTIRCLFESGTLHKDDILKIYNYMFTIITLYNIGTGQIALLYPLLEQPDHFIPIEYLNNSLFTITRSTCTKIIEPEKPKISKLEISNELLYDYKMDWREIPF